MDKEIWKNLIYDDIPYINYEISTFGNIRNTKTKHILKLFLNNEGYLQVNIKPYGRKGKSKTIKIHRAVAFAFVNNTYNKPFVNHKNGIKTTNKSYNLEWVTARENTQHAVLNKLIDYSKNSGINNVKSLLTKEDVEFIRINYVPRDKVYGCRALAKLFKVSHKTIHGITSYKTYK